MPDGVESLWKLALAILVAVAIGTTARHASAIRSGHYTVTWKLILLELPQVVGQCLLAMGFYEYFDLEPLAAIGLAFVLGWLGMRGLQAFVERALVALRGGGDRP